MTKIETHLYRAAALFTDPKDVRPALHYIRVENHPQQGVILVATNGHALIALHDPLAAPVAHPLLIPANLKPAASSYGIEVHPDGSTNAVGGPTFAPVDEPGFPERWRDVVRVPASRELLPHAVGVDPKYLELIGKAARVLGAKGIACCTPPTERSIITYKITEYATAVVMPYAPGRTTDAGAAVWDAMPAVWDAMP